MSVFTRIRGNVWSYLQDPFEENLKTHSLEIFDLFKEIKNKNDVSIGRYTDSTNTKYSVGFPSNFFRTEYENITGFRPKYADILPKDKPIIKMFYEPYKKNNEIPDNLISNNISIIRELKNRPYEIIFRIEKVNSDVSEINISPIYLKLVYEENLKAIENSRLMADTRRKMS